MGRNSFLVVLLSFLFSPIASGLSVESVIRSNGPYSFTGTPQQLVLNLEGPTTGAAYIAADVPFTLSGTAPVEARGVIYVLDQTDYALWVFYFAPGEQQIQGGSLAIPAPAHRYQVSWETSSAPVTLTFQEVPEPSVLPGSLLLMCRRRRAQKQQ